MLKLQEIKKVHPDGSIWIGEHKGKTLKSNRRIALHTQAMSFHEDIVDVAKNVFTQENRTADVTENRSMFNVYDELMHLLEYMGLGKLYVIHADLNKTTDVSSHYRMIYVPCATPDSIDLDIQTGEKGIFKLPLNEGTYVIMPPNSGIRVHAPEGKMFLCLCMALGVIL